MYITFHVLSLTKAVCSQWIILNVLLCKISCQSVCGKILQRGNVRELESTGSADKFNRSSDATHTVALNSALKCHLSLRPWTGAWNHGQLYKTANAATKASYTVRLVVHKILHKNGSPPTDCQMIQSRCRNVYVLLHHEKI